MNAAADALRWGVKESFLGYVRGLDDGRIETLGDCVQVDDVFIFPREGSVDSALGFAGGVHFTGFAGMLDIRLVDPMIEDGGDERLLTVLVGPPAIAARVAIATIGEARRSSSGGWTVTPQLTFEGTRVFGDVYPVGTELAPLVVDSAA